MKEERMASKRIMGLATLLMVLSMLLAACGGETPTNTAVPAAAATNTTAPAAADTPATSAQATNTAAPAAAATDTPASGGATTPSGNMFSWRAYAEPETLDPALMQENLS